ncbi:MAG: hypothetical protein IJ736_16740, partial [Firmicutes bacterium]|nr:hypothetical protein [Bacillota bacterium]
FSYLSYLLGGRIEFGDVRIYCNDNLTFQDELGEISWNLEPLYEPYGKKKVRKSIEKVLLNSSKEDFQTIADKFLLTERRYEVKYKNLSGERWRAASAFGYAQNKRIYFAPYMPSKFYYNMCRSGLLKALRELAKSGALVILPVGSDEFIKHIADKVIYLNRSYDIDSVRSYYDKHFGGKWIH